MSQKKNKISEKKFVFDYNKIATEKLINKASKSISLYGFCVIENIISKSDLNAIRKEIINARSKSSENIKRVIPDGLCAEINLKKINTLQIFRWLKKNNISDIEMLKTFNCGIGFCLIINPKNINKINKFFSKSYRPYVIGRITSGQKKVRFNDKIRWF